MGWKLDLKNDTADTLDALRPGPGWYRVTLEDTGENAETGNQEFKFRIAGPTMTGGIHTEFLNRPDLAQTEHQLAICVKKAKNWAKRLGLITDTDLGHDDVDIEWAKAIGRELVLHLNERSYFDQKTQAQKSVTQIDWAPYPLDHQGIPAAARVTLGLPLLPGQTTDAPPKPKAAPRGKAAQLAHAGANGTPPPTGEIDVTGL